MGEDAKLDITGEFTNEQVIVKALLAHARANLDKIGYLFTAEKLQRALIKAAKLFGRDEKLDETSPLTNKQVMCQALINRANEQQKRLLTPEVGTPHYKVEADIKKLIASAYKLDPVYTTEIATAGRDGAVKQSVLDAKFGIGSRPSGRSLAGGDGNKAK